MAVSGHSTATLRLTVGTLRIAHPVTVPNAPVLAAEIVPALQALVNAVVETAEAGQAISCRKGCGACCRQLVPVSRTEGERLLQLVAAMPNERRAALSARFAAAGRTYAREIDAMEERLAGLIREGQNWSLDWLRPPILQPDTRLVAMANPSTGRLLVQGWEKTGPATGILDMTL